MSEDVPIDFRDHPTKADWLRCRRCLARMRKTAGDAAEKPIDMFRRRPITCCNPCDGVSSCGMYRPNLLRASNSPNTPKVEGPYTVDHPIYGTPVGFHLRSLSTSVGQKRMGRKDAGCSRSHFGSAAKVKLQRTPSTGFAKCFD